MKKCLPILLALVLFALVIQFVVNMFVSERSVEYVLKTEDNKYMIKEHLKVVDDVHYYDFKIVDEKDDFYTFSFVNDFNRQTEVIEDIKYFTADNLSCVFPVYKREKYGEVSCLYNGEQVSYSYLKQINNSDISAVTDKIEKLGYERDEWNRSVSKNVELSSENRKISVYQENILEDYTFLIWRYKGLYILKNKESVVKDYLEHDQYDNKLSALVGRYYVSADPSSTQTRISELAYYNTKVFGRGKIDLLEETSNNYYFNGVFKGKLYMTDVGNGKQYSIDPAYEKVVEVGSKDTSFVSVEGGKLVEVKPSEFLSKEVYFTDFIDNEEIINLFGQDIEIVKERSFYYFRTSDGAIYKAHEDNVSKPVLLFKFNDLTEWKIENGDILAVAGDTVYFYTDEDGLLPIAVNSELKYNHYNICDFWKE